MGWGLSQAESPHVAYRRATYLRSLLPQDYIHKKQIGMIAHWTRVACMRGPSRKGNPKGNLNSQIMIPWSNLPDDPTVRRCACDRLADLYPCDFPKQTTTKPRKAGIHRAYSAQATTSTSEGYLIIPRTLLFQVGSN